MGAIETINFTIKPPIAFSQDDKITLLFKSNWGVDLQLVSIHKNGKEVKDTSYSMEINK